MANGLSGNCAICGVWRRSLHRDHVVPKFKGGADDPSNIQLICANCHEDKTVEDLKGRRLTPEQKERQRQGQLGGKRSEVTRLRMQVAHLQKRLDDPEYDLKIKTLGTNKSPEWVAKIAEANRGQTRSEEQRMKMRAAHLGKPLSAEHAQKIAMAHTGKKQDAATRARISAALLLVDRPLRRCDDCGLESLPAALGHHQSRKGHSGYTEVVKIV